MTICPIAGPVAGPRSDLSAPDAHVEAVPAVLRNPTRRVADQVAVTELGEDVEEDRSQVRRRLDREERTAGHVREVLQEALAPRRAGGDAVDDDVRAPGGVQDRLG